ncbi:MAG: DNA-formamidopyrimidine glycosylase family protein [Dehalococcoidia bacterium]
MPEIPDLEAIRHYLHPRVQENAIEHVSVPIPWLVRTGAAEFDSLIGRQFTSIQRVGKFLLFQVDDGRVLVVNPMLTGIFHWVEPQAKKPGMLALVIGFQDGHELRYSDQRRMGRWYLVAGEEDLPSVPQMDRLGPDVMTLDEESFVEVMRKRRGQVKSIITNQEVMAGIGNAYSDEILWNAGIHPHRKGSTLNDDDRRRLFQAIQSVLHESVQIVDETVQAEGLGRKEEWREHLRVHRRAGKPCPRCGGEIRGQTRGGSETNYCVSCQPLFEAAIQTGRGQA